MAAGGPKYWVDGARSDVAEGPALPEDQYAAQCVPYSPERTDLLICGDVSTGFRPGGEPGDETVYGDVCAAAEDSAKAEGLLAIDETLVSDSCYVFPTSSWSGKDASSAEYLVSFKRVSDSGTTHVTIPLDLDNEAGS